MKASDLFVRCLEAEGVERIFGVPGEENADFMISLIDSKLTLCFAGTSKAPPLPQTLMVD